jgi:hypothetical protein
MGPRGYSGVCVLAIGDRLNRLEQLFEHVRLAALSDTRFAEEREITIYLCSGPKFDSLARLWPSLKYWR